MHVIWITLVVNRKAKTGNKLNYMLRVKQGIDRLLVNCAITILVLGLLNHCMDEMENSVVHQKNKNGTEIVVQMRLPLL